MELFKAHQQISSCLCGISGITNGNLSFLCTTRQTLLAGKSSDSRIGQRTMNQGICVVFLGDLHTPVYPVLQPHLFQAKPPCHREQRPRLLRGLLCPPAHQARSLMNLALQEYKCQAGSAQSACPYRVGAVKKLGRVTFMFAVALHAPILPNIEVASLMPKPAYQCTLRDTSRSLSAGR